LPSNTELIILSIFYMISSKILPEATRMQPLSSIPSSSTQSSPSKEALSASVKDRDKVELSTPPQQSETVSISQTGQEINQYTEAMAELPDIREERIAQIQEALEKGTYSVSSQDLADKLIQELSS
jgi:negative regulator of flagellin synthesis FlgM